MSPVSAVPRPQRSPPRPPGSVQGDNGLHPWLQAWVAKEHSYEVPEWITLLVTGGSDAYLAWVTEESAPSPPSNTSRREPLELSHKLALMEWKPKGNGLGAGSAHGGGAGFGSCGEPA
ncbi:divalent cation tolerance protein CutA [Streptomyces sp. F-3]|uniref:divalent cation tolerance protein CutA n=1 Tax=Streptomyces sp. F-3 TaxID=1840095 RepID=UPI003FA72E10